MQRIVRTLTMAEARVVSLPQVLICDRDRKWSPDVRRRLRDAGIRVVLIRERARNANAYAERFVRSINEECPDRIIPIGERHFRHAITEFVEHYHRERSHQGLDNRLIAGTPPTDRTGRVRRDDNSPGKARNVRADSSEKLPRGRDGSAPHGSEPHPRWRTVLTERYHQTN